METATVKSNPHTSILAYWFGRQGVKVRATISCNEHRYLHQEKRTRKVTMYPPVMETNEGEIGRLRREYFDAERKAAPSPSLSL